MPFKVLVDDNFHPGDEDERYEKGEYKTWEEALAAAKQTVDNCLENDFNLYYKPGMTAEEMYRRYTAFGDDPFILPDSSTPYGPPFSAWEYAKLRCSEMVEARRALE